MNYILVNWKHLKILCEELGGKKTSKWQTGKLKVKRKWVAQSTQSVNQHFSLIRNMAAKYNFKNHLSESESEKGYKKKSFQNVYEPQGNVNPTWVLQAQSHCFGLIFFESLCTYLNSVLSFFPLFWNGSADFFSQQNRFERIFQWIRSYKSLLFATKFLVTKN